MKANIALLPLDDRPVNYDYPSYLARAAGCALQLPPREWLGTPWRESQHARLVNWLVQITASVDAVVLAVDSLAYGGLIPSRTSREPFDHVMEHLSVLRKIKSDRPDLTILASSVIQRISRANSSEEERDYWATYGSAMFRLSFLEHKIALGEASPEEGSEAVKLRKQIPSEVYDDYRQGRSRNHAVNQAMLDWLEEGILDYLLLPQDDTADYGWNIAEARSLQAKIRSHGLGERAITYPGADEIGTLLLASLLCRRVGLRLSVWPRYASVHSPNVITSYEDRPVHELLKAHLAPLDGHISVSPESADLVLFFNAPCQVQGEGMYQWLVWRGLENLKQGVPDNMRGFFDQVVGDPVYQNTRREMESPHRNPEEFIRALMAELDTERGLGHPVALADVAFVNGSDLILGNLLVKHPEIARLGAYGGWNTAGNTLGTVLAQAAVRVLGLNSEYDEKRLQAHLEFLFLRFLDDYYYQARERTLIMLEDLPVMGLPVTMERLVDPENVSKVEDCVRKRLLRAARELEEVFIRSGLVKQVRLSHIYLPWQRLFEVGFDVQVTLA